MIESGYYPPGAEFDPNAPYNEVELPEEEFDVCISSSLSKSTTVTTNDYSVDSWDEEDGNASFDTSDTNWEQAYNNDGHYTPLELIQKFKEVLSELVKDTDIKPRKKKEYEHLISECEGWSEDELEVIED